MKIPNPQKAVVEIRKLRDYCLNPEHRIGKHKARLYKASLGLTIEDAEALRAVLREIVKTHEAELGDKDEHGQRYQIEFEMTWQDKHAKLLSAWNVRPNEAFARLVTCYPIKSR
ncbi:MAG: hypothetical protein M3X11_08880 [Acidobacteriota bacterium]|nr:hypothetical protein [Acidobacteriota bacterium]